jgi:steroid 5-alpha reductase family enzyme
MFFIAKYRFKVPALILFSGLVLVLVLLLINYIFQGTLAGAAFYSLLVVLALAVSLIYVIAKYCYGVATRTGRSRIGFVWLSIFFPALALVICLVLDQDENRYKEVQPIP